MSEGVKQEERRPAFMTEWGSLTTDSLTGDDPQLQQLQNQQLDL